MSYTNQDQYNTTDATGDFNKTSGQFGSTNPFDNSRTTKGGNDFGTSRDPNAFSTAGNTDSPSDNFGSARGTQTSDFSNTNRAGFGSNDAATTGFSSGGATVGGSDMYGAQSGNTTGFDDRKMDTSGNTMAGYGEGFGAGTGTDFSSTGRDTTARSDDVYGNYTGSAGRTHVPPAGFRGGANDPAYQPGQHYDHKAGGLTRDDGEEVGTNNVTTGQVMPGRHATQPINTSDTTATSMGLGSGTGATQHVDTTNTAATSTGLGSGRGTGTGMGTDNWEKKDDTDFGRTSGTTDTEFGTSGTPLTAPGFDNSGTSDFKTDTSDFRPLGTTTGNTSTTGTNRGFNAGQQVNTAGGGEGWQSGTTGLTEEEIKRVQKGRHAPGAVDAHPNPNVMDSYDV